MPDLSHFTAGDCFHRDVGESVEPSLGKGDRKED